MPVTPRRRSKVLTRLIKLSKNKKTLKKKGFVLSKHEVRQLEVGKTEINTISNRIEDMTKRGTIHMIKTEKRLAPF